MSDLWQISQKISLDNYLFTALAEAILAVKLHYHPDQQRFFGKVDEERVAAVKELLHQLLDLAENSNQLYASSNLIAGDEAVYADLLRKLRQNHPNEGELKERLQNTEQLLSQYQSLDPQKQEDLLEFLDEVKDLVALEVASQGHFGHI